MTSNISKSNMIAGLQCPKRLYLAIRKPEVAEDSELVQRLFDRGREAHDVARGLYPGGKLIEHYHNPSLALKETQDVISKWKGQPLFEPAFVHGGVLVRADILLKNREGVHLIEVKSSTKVMDYQIEDVAIQAWVLENQGIKLHSIALAVIDNNFVYRGKGDYRGLFRYEAVTDRARQLYPEIPKLIKQFNKVLAGPEPNIAMGRHCRQPFECTFEKYCSRFFDTAEFPVILLPKWGNTVEELIAEGYRDLRDVPVYRLINPTHQRIHQVTLSGVPELDPAAGEYLRAQPYPRFYLDFETIDFVVPLWEGTRPFQQIPFQWSCHIEEEAGVVRHELFLHDSSDLPLESFAKSLLEVVGKEGPIMVYSPFEKRIIKELSASLPELAKPLMKLVPRLVDVLSLAREHYYHPLMMGSWSLKKVLPTVSTGPSYEDLDEVRDGLSAQKAYVEMINPKTSKSRRNELRKQLLDYGKLDTLSLVRLTDFFQRESKRKRSRPEVSSSRSHSRAYSRESAKRRRQKASDGQLAGQMTKLLSKWFGTAREIYRTWSRK